MLKRSWGGEVCNVSVLVAVGVAEDGYREILGVSEGVKEDREGWSNFLRVLKRRGLRGTQLLITDKCLGLVESLAEHFSEARWQRCMVHLYRNVFTQVPRGAKVREVRRRTRVVGNLPDGESALMLVAARLRHISGTKWGTRKYLDMERLNHSHSKAITN